MAWRNFLVLFFVFFVTGFAFGMNPQWDLKISGLFFQDGDWIGRKEPYALMRELYYLGAVGFCIYVGFMAIWSRFRSTQVPKLYYPFFIWLFLIANILVVNWGFKEFSGRARPYLTQVFGGEMVFTPVSFLPADQCASNCSFVSGEASAAMILILAFMPLCTKFGAKLGIWIIFLPMAFMRVMAGKHFISDVLMGMIITAVIYWLMLAIIRKTPADFATSGRAFWSDFKAVFSRHKSA